jgi:Protein of unknown function (DUF4239)
MTATAWAILFVAVCAAVCLLALTLVRRSVTIQRLETHHEVAGFLIGIVGVVYAVLLAFVVIVVWERYNDAGRGVAQEANQIGDLWQMAGGFGPELQTQARGSLVAYARAVIDTEFASMRQEEASREAEAAFARIWNVYRSAEPRSETEKALFDESLATMNVLSDARQTRLHEARDHTPGVVWAALFGGAAITIGFTFLFQLKSFSLQLVMTASVVVLIALVLFLIIALNRPFGGVLPLDADPFVAQVARMAT